MTELQWTVVAGATIVLLWVLVANFRDSSRAKKRITQSASVTEEPLLAPPAERIIEGVLPSEISEAIAILEWQLPASVAKLQQELRGWRHVGSKPLAFGWVSRPGEAAQAQPQSQEVFALQVGLLLATRSGPLHAMEYSEWQEQLGRIAGALGARLTVPSMSDVLSKARQVDQRCAEVDAQLTLAVTSVEILSAAKIASAASAAGLEPRGESRFAKGPLHRQRFSVFPGESGVSLILLLDVPRTVAPVEAFREMIATAELLASVLDAQVTDEAGHRLLAQNFEGIAAQVADKEQRLLAMGITPGTPMAQRLFL
ncbi:MAG: hypothetical protein EBU74_01375 [Betaproteobacteria bacterium]|jgi:hypothetical protein|nr:hypothetical protein [Betaproteobacteria bacterium]